MGLGLVAALGAALCYGIASVLQAYGTRRAAAAGPAPSGPKLGVLAATVRSWPFLLGTALDLVGFGSSSVAARLLPLFLAQTVMSANLVVTAVLAGWLLRIPLRGREWTAVAVVCAGLVALALSSGAEGTHEVGDRAHWAVLVAAAVVVGAGAVVATRGQGPAASTAAGLLGGVGFGVLGIGVRMLRGIAPFSVQTLLADPALYGLALGGVGGMALYALALQGGAVAGPTAALVVGETVLPGAVGLWSFGDTARPGFGWLGALGFVLAIGGALVVARFGEVRPGAEAPASVAR